jgi:hypothetical protein
MRIETTIKTPLGVPSETMLLQFLQHNYLVLGTATTPPSLVHEFGLGMSLFQLLFGWRNQKSRMEDNVTSLVWTPSITNACLIFFLSQARPDGHRPRAGSVGCGRAPSAGSGRELCLPHGRELRRRLQWPT